MYPIAFEIGSLSIRWYGVMAAVGFLAAVWVLDRNRKFAELTKDQCSTILIMALITGILGARIFYVIQFFHYFRNDLWRIIRIDQGGLVFYGGFLLALATVVIYTKIQKLDTVRVLDTMAPSLAIGHAFGRIGCFLNGCCYGRMTEYFWGVTAPEGSQLAILTGGNPVHPVQLVEAGENFLLCLLYCWMLRHTKRGMISAVFLIVYGILRCINETLRGDNVLYFHLTPAQWIGIILIPAGIILLGWFIYHDRKSA